MNSLLVIPSFYTSNLGFGASTVYNGPKVHWTRKCGMFLLLRHKKMKIWKISQGNMHNIFINLTKLKFLWIKDLIGKTDTPNWIEVKVRNSLKQKGMGDNSHNRTYGQQGKAIYKWFLTKLKSFYKARKPSIGKNDSL